MSGTYYTNELRLSCAELVYVAIRLLSAFSDGFRNILFYLGWAGFFVCYIMFLAGMRKLWAV